MKVEAENPTDVLKSFVSSGCSDGLQNLETNCPFESEYERESVGSPDSTLSLDCEITVEIEWATELPGNAERPSDLEPVMTEEIEYRTDVPNLPDSSYNVDASAPSEPTKGDEIDSASESGKSPDCVRELDLVKYFEFWSVFVILYKLLFLREAETEKCLEFSDSADRLPT
jgi:hypothetical protein